MVIDTQTIGAVTVLRPEGPVSGAEDGAQFRGSIEGLAARAKGRVVLDAAEIAFVDSEGLEAMLDLAEALESIGQSLRLGAAGETLRETILLNELSVHFELYDDVQDAVRSFR